MVQHTSKHSSQRCVDVLLEIIMPKKNIQAITKTATNTNNLNGKFNWILNHPFRFLVFILASSTAMMFSDKIRKFFGREQPQNQLIPSRSNLEAFVPTTSIAYEHVKARIDNDCQDAGYVSPSFAQINGYAYATEYCILRNKSLKKCSNILGEISSPQLAKQKKLPTKLAGVDLVKEGNYKIVEFKKTIATVGLSFCVGMAITHPNSPNVLLAHINAENILANDDYLKGKTKDPFIVIKDFIANSNLDWKVTLASGSPANIVYIKTVLENIGLHNIDSYCEPGWANVFWGKDGVNRLNYGAIMIKEGQPFVVKNPQDFEHLFASIPEYQKDKPAALRLR